MMIVKAYITLNLSTYIYRFQQVIIISYISPLIVKKFLERLCFHFIQCNWTILRVNNGSWTFFLSLSLAEGTLAPPPPTHPPPQNLEEGAKPPTGYFSEASEE